jgi:hypothetical protein
MNDFVPAQTWLELADGLQNQLITPVLCVQFPLVSRSGYMKGLLMDSKEVELSSECPGGPEIFEMVANFCYGSTILMEASSVAALRCMAEYLHMFEEYGKANLCQRSELYLTQVRIARTLSWKHLFFSTCCNSSVQQTRALYLLQLRSFAQITRASPAVLSITLHNRIG